LNELLVYYVRIHYKRGVFVLIVLAQLTQRVSASVSWLTTPNWLELAKDAFYLIGSAVCRLWSDSEQLSEQALFFVFQSVSRANT
jgi:hypothetical protein